MTKVLARAGLLVSAAGVAALLLPVVPTAPMATAGAAPRPDVRTIQTPSGAVVADSDGMTLYVFVDDLLTKARNACTGDCLNDWPPALVARRGRVTIGKGITGRIGTVRRSGGERQLTMDGRPLYRFSGDRKAGEVRGNGIGNLWWAMTPTGLSATAFPVGKPTYPAPAATTLTVVHSADGPIVANSRGQALYLYTDDTPTASACQATWCLVDWPPLAAQGAPDAPATITAALGTIHGAGGTTQITLGGHPLYTFAGDLHPGDVLGEGIGGDWYLVSPSGTAVLPHRSSGTGTGGQGGGK